MLFLLNMIHALFHSHVEQKTAKLCHVSETEKKISCNRIMDLIE